MAYAPVLLVVDQWIEGLFPLAVLAAVLLADLLLPITVVLGALGWRRAGRASFSPAMLPDLDMKLPVVKHRGITHTVWFALVAAVAGALIGYFLLWPVGAFLLPDRSWSRLVGTAFFCYLGFHAVITHLLGDVLTPAGIRPFSPVADTEVSLCLVKAANTPANALLYVAGVGSVVVAIVSVL